MTMMGIMVIISMVRMSSTVIIVPRVSMKDMAITLSVVSNEHGDHDEHHAELSMNLNLDFPPSGP